VKLVIFIGHHKVGSTSLQGFLSSNRKRLLSSGILYPGIQRENVVDGTYNLAYRAVKSLLRKPLYERIPMNIREPHNALALRMLQEGHHVNKPIDFHRNVPSSKNIFSFVRQQIDIYQPKAVILCAEAFTNFAGDMAELVVLLKRALPAENVRIICSLRRVDQYICSWYGQRLKLGHVMKPLRGQGLTDIFGSIHFNYRKILRAWYKGFPEGEFVVRNYSDVLANGGSIPDFIRSSDLDFPADLPVSTGANQGIPFCFYELCRVANHELSPTSTRQIRNLAIRRYDRSVYPENRRIELLGAEHRQKIFDRFQPIHEFLIEETGCKPFFHDQQDILNVADISEFEASKISTELFLESLMGGWLSREARKFVKSFNAEKHF
jgi:hypothetical protein